jgi:N6-adenosine-specific RNA methylase IME4
VKRYGTIVADPPWPYDDQRGPCNAEKWGMVGGVVGSTPRYGRMGMPQLCALRPPALEQAHLYLWVTNAFLIDGSGYELARAWGFDPKTLITWLKVRADGTPSGRAGYYQRGATEHCIFATRGSLRLRGSVGDNVIVTRRLAHSIKPDELYRRAAVQSPGPYLEMFARRRRAGVGLVGRRGGGGGSRPDGLGSPPRRAQGVPESEGRVNTYVEIAES